MPFRSFFQFGTGPRTTPSDIFHPPLPHKNQHQYEKPTRNCGEGGNFAGKEGFTKFAQRLPTNNRHNLHYEKNRHK